MEKPSLETLDIHSTGLYVQRGYPFAEWDLLRREAPIFWYERGDVEPFWAITRHADVLTISKRSDVFVNSRRLRIQTIEQDEMQTSNLRMRAEALGWDPDEPMDFVFMDDPRHRNFRLVTARRFTPAALRQLEGHFDELASGFAEEFSVVLDRSLAADEPCDFVRGFAQKLPLAAIGEMMGLPRGDWKRLKMITNLMIGAPEPDYYDPGEARDDALQRSVTEMFQYLIEQAQDRLGRGPGGDDLTSLIAHAKVEGKPLNMQQIFGYLFLVLVAGNETTQNAIVGGVHALLENPDQRDLLCAHPELVESAAEEILRWTSPVVQFARTPIEDFELSGVKIKAGEDVAMWYPSANRDEAVFKDPYRFDITRKPNRHLAFGGYGAHFCLGANLARWELRAALRALIPVLPRMQAAGSPERTQNLHIPAIHRLLVRAAA